MDKPSPYHANTLTLIKTMALFEEEHAGHKSGHYMEVLSGLLERAEVARQARDADGYAALMLEVFGVAAWGYLAIRNAQRASIGAVAGQPDETA